jgi:hypothetical protein
VDPIRFEFKEDRLGLGKAEVDQYFLVADNIKRKTDIELEETNPDAIKKKKVNHMMHQRWIGLKIEI